MKYMGSKAKYAAEILPIILKNRQRGQLYIEPFAGGMNMIDKVENPRIANDLNPYLIEMFRALQNGWNPPEYITKEQHAFIRENKKIDALTGWVGFNCSYSGVFFGGFAGVVLTKENILRNYQDEAIRNVEKQMTRLKGVLFSCRKYNDIHIPVGSIVYCDPPYENTSGYKVESFDHLAFWQWVRQISQHSEVYVSEYNAPPDFECIWSKTVKSSLSANGKSGKSIESVEKLFRLIK